MSRAQQIEARAALYVMRRSEREWCEEDERELERWLAESMAHKAAFWRLEHGWERVGRIAVLPHEREALEDARCRLSLRRVAAVAAAVLAIVCAGLFVFYEKRTPEAPASAVAYATQIGAHRIVALPDHSIVELNTASAIQATLDATRREVQLRHGEAYFEVAHDGARPFVVQAGAQQITVLGTKFMVRSEASKVTVAVLQGRVRLQSNSEDAAGSTTLTPGHVAVVNGASMLISRRSLASIEDQLAWRDGFIRFEAATLSQVAAEFNRYNATQLVILDRAAAEITIGGTFQSSNVDAFARLLQRAYGLRVEASEHEVKISSAAP